MYTDIFRPKDLERISNLSESFPCITELSIDLNDCDKVLRVASARDISRLLIDYLEIEDIKCKLMGVYQRIEEKVTVLFELKN
jgi:hypothetical protein